MEYASGDAAQGMDEVASLARHNKIEAIRRLRELTGLGLKEAKEVVEAMATGSPVQISTSFSTQVQNHELPPEVAEMLRSGRKIDAIRIIREVTGLGLKEAKDMAEAIETALSQTTPLTATQTSRSVELMAPAGASRSLTMNVGPRVVGADEQRSPVAIGIIVAALVFLGLALARSMGWM